jgi:uncharacterized protein (DUF433 family)
VGRDEPAVARDDDLSLTEVQAALAYYQAHLDEIERRIEENELALSA